MRRGPVSSAAGVSNSGEMSTISVDAEQLGEEHRDEDRRRALALGDEVADRRVAIDVLGDLRGERELADGGRGLEVERLEVDRLGLRRADHLDDARQRLALGQVARPRLVHEGAERVVDLHRVDAQVDVRHAEPRRLQEARERGDRALGAPASGAASISESSSADQRLGGDEIVAVAARDDVGGLREREAAGPDLLERRDLLVDGGDGEIELAGDLAREALHLRAVAEAGLQGEEAVADVVERRPLLPEADQEREGPLDVGAPVEVVADPGGDRREPRRRASAPCRRSAPSPTSKKSVEQLDVGVAQVADRALRARACS